MFYLFLGLIFVNLFLYYHSYIFLIFLFLCMWMIGKRCDIKLCLFCSVCILLFFSININYYNFHTQNTFIKKELKVIEKHDNYSIVGNKKEKYLMYNNDYEFYNGSLIYLEGKVSNIEKSYNSFYKYLNKKGVNYEIDCYKLYVLNNDKKVNEIIVDKLLENKTRSSKSYLKLMLFNVRDEYNEGFYNTFSVYSLTYLIAVSGFHIRVLLMFLKKILKKEFVCYGVIGFYLYLLDFSISSYRAFMYSIFKKVNKKLNFNLSSNDLLSLIGSVFIFINPSVMFSFSFIFSFLTTFVIEIFKVYSKRKWLLGIYIYLVNIPIVLLSYYKLNLSTIIFSLLLGYPISFLYVFSFVFLFFDKFYLLYELVIFLFFKLFSFLDSFNLVLIFGKPSSVFIIFYYLVLLLFFIMKERGSKFKFCYICLIFLLLSYQYYKPIINSNEQIYFLNVGQGDCAVFVVPNSKKVVLVDTGGSKYNDVATNKIIPFLESKGINEIDKIIITHDDFDHNGALNSLKNNFIVNQVIDDSMTKNIMIGNSVFTNLNITDRRDNEGSIVLYGKYAGYDFLLMGDATFEVERKIVNEVNNVDILKVGHHGSNTSSDYDFLSKINGKIAIISVGENNNYGHPSEEVLDNLSKAGYVVLRTDENNNIGFGKNIFNISFIDYFK